MAQPPDRRGGVASLGEALSRYLRETHLDRRLVEHEVLAAWRRALGPELCERARAVRFRDGELLVEVASAALLQELANFTGEPRRREANRLLGAERIRSVTFQPRR